MDIAILETGLLPPELRDEWPGGYPAMMQALLAAPHRRFHTFKCAGGAAAGPDAV